MTNRNLLIDFLGWYQRNTLEEGTENEKWMDEQTVDSYLSQAQLQQHVVMQAEGSDVSEGAAVGQRSGDTGVCDGFNTENYYCFKCKKMMAICNCDD